MIYSKITNSLDFIIIYLTSILMETESVKPKIKVIIKFIFNEQGVLL